jgi:hypothetical protein
MGERSLPLNEEALPTVCAWMLMEIYGAVGVAVRGMMEL